MRHHRESIFTLERKWKIFDTNYMNERFFRGFQVESSTKPRYKSFAIELTKFPFVDGQTDDGDILPLGKIVVHAACDTSCSPSINEKNSKRFYFV